MNATKTLLTAALLLALMGSAGCAARAAGAGDALSEDERVLAEVQRVIVEQEEIVAEDLTVTVNGGVVVLEGVQGEAGAVSEMLQRIARVRGVNEVVNRIRILRPPAGRLAGARDGRPAA